MAVDQALLVSANETGQIILRFYRWSPATLSLGYFQSAAERETHSASIDCDLVRRTTGGGAILHDQELTYSLCVPCSNRFSANHAELYARVHGAVIESLRDWGVRATLYPGSKSRAEAGRFLCFQRRSPGDIIVGNMKICGSAQRRMNAAILQHGSIVLATSPFAPEVEGVREASGANVPSAALTIRLTECLSQQLQLAFLPSQLHEREQIISHEIQQKQFAQHDWNFRR